MPLDPSRLRPLDAPWTAVRLRDTSASTNAEVAEAARAGAPTGLVVATDHQSAGRGRQGRDWQSPPGAGLAMSVLLRPAVTPARWPWLPLLVGVAVRDAVAALGVDARLKWPNDVLVGDRKLAGILTERVEGRAGAALRAGAAGAAGGVGAAAVVGVGLNVAMSAEQRPVPTATSLTIEGADTDADTVLGLVLTALGARVLAWEAADGDPEAGLRDAYETASDTLGTRVRVHLPAGDDLVGTAVGLDPAGRLLVDTAGRTTAIAAGDVVHLRPVV